MANFYFSDDLDKIKPKHAKALLSAGYREWLGRLCTQDVREKFGLPEGATWADAIAFQTIKRAVALIGKEEICFTAITEIRESTEGKTPEKIMVAQNEELLALARSINSPPALEPGTPQRDQDNGDE